MESAVSNTKEGLQVMSVGVLFVALKNGQSRYKVSLLQEHNHIWQLVFFLTIFMNCNYYLFLSNLLGQRLLFAFNGRTGSYHF
jgi:hypothetical protein